MGKQDVIFSQTGTVTNISSLYHQNYSKSECDLLIEVKKENGNFINFIVTPNTYIYQQQEITLGMTIIGFFDINAPTPLIYPPRHHALVIAAISDDYNYIFDWFDKNLLNSNDTIQLFISPETKIVTNNGQLFNGSVAEHYSLVQYKKATRSIPSQINAIKIVVMCRDLF